MNATVNEPDWSASSNPGDDEWDGVVQVEVTMKFAVLGEAEATARQQATKFVTYISDLANEWGAGVGSHEILAG